MNKRLVTILRRARLLTSSMIFGVSAYAAIGLYQSNWPDNPGDCAAQIATLSAAQSDLETFSAIERGEIENRYIKYSSKEDRLIRRREAELRLIDAKHAAGVCLGAKERFVPRMREASIGIALYLFGPVLSYIFGILLAIRLGRWLLAVDMKPKKGMDGS